VNEIVYKMECRSMGKSQGSEKNMTIDASVAGFEPLYGKAEQTDGLIPWDIGGPQPAVQQLVAYGAIRGQVLDPGTGPGYHAIHQSIFGRSLAVYGREEADPVFRPA
jgi:hypothetical protein